MISSRSVLILLSLLCLAIPLTNATELKRRGPTVVVASKTTRTPTKVGMLEARQSVVIPPSAAGLSLCAEADVTLLTIDVVQGLCLCAVGGVLTPGSLTRLNDTLSAQTGTIADLINQVGGLAQALTQTVDTLDPATGTTPLDCGFPPNSVPLSCTDCSYACADGYYLCGTQCIPTTQACVSGIPQRKRTLSSLAEEARCPIGQTACLIPSSSKRSTRLAYECLDVRHDIESCGGCQFPLPGKPQGQDCTAIPDVGSVSCIHDRCVIDSCIEGFASNGTACVLPSSIIVSEKSSSDLLTVAQEALRLSAKFGRS